jgi:hypothetical protein
MMDLGATMHNFLSFLVYMESSERIGQLKCKAMSILQVISDIYVDITKCVSVSLIIYV